MWFCLEIYVPLGLVPNHSLGSPFSKLAFPASRHITVQPSSQTSPAPPHLLYLPPSHCLPQRLSLSLSPSCVQYKQPPTTNTIHTTAHTSSFAVTLIHNLVHALLHMTTCTHRTHSFRLTEAITCTLPHKCLTPTEPISPRFLLTSQTALL